MNDRLGVALPLGLAVIAAGLALPLRLRSTEPTVVPSAASAIATSSSSSLASSGPQCPADVLALVTGPSTLGAWTVVRFDCSRARQLGLELVRGETHAVLTVAAEGAVEHPPPAHAGSYALFYGGGAIALPPDEITTLLDALAARIAHNAAPAPQSW